MAILRARQTFTAQPDAARQAALAQGTASLLAIVLDYAVAGATGPRPIARLSQALEGIRSDAEATIIAEWPGIEDEPGLALQWSHVIAAAVYEIGVHDFPIDDHQGDELARGREIIAVAADHAPTRQPAQGALTALRARGSAHPDDPADPVRPPHQ